MILFTRTVIFKIYKKFSYLYMYIITRNSNNNLNIYFNRLKFQLLYFVIF